MPYGPHAPDDRERMLAALGISSVDELFADIPEGLRASGLDLPEPEPELHLAARLQARLPATGPSSPRSSAPACTATGSRPQSTSCCPWGVVHGLHAVPAGDQPGHAPEHLRVRSR